MTVLLFIASLLLPLATGILLAFLLCPVLKNGAAGRAFALFAGSGLGIGIASCLAFLCLLTDVTHLIPVVDLGVALAAGVGWFLVFRRPAAGEVRPLPETRKRSPFEILLAGIFSLELIASAASFILAFLKEPHGRWDAWLIWNMHARFLFRGGDHWREAFASGLDWSHWDYPLLLPLTIVRSWGYMGEESLRVPPVIAGFFTLLTLGLLCSSLCLLRSRSQGYLAAMILMGTPFFITLGASQFADIPLACFVLMTLVLLLFPARSAVGCGGALILAGCAAALAAWTKNEGILFFLIATAGLFGTTIYSNGWKQAFRRTAAFLAGALPVLMIVIYFKLRIAPANDLMAGAQLGRPLGEALRREPVRPDRPRLFRHGDQFHAGVDRCARGDAPQSRRRQYHPSDRVPSLRGDPDPKGRSARPLSDRGHPSADAGRLLLRLCDDPARPDLPPHHVAEPSLPAVMARRHPPRLHDRGYTG